MYFYPSRRNMNSGHFRGPLPVSPGTSQKSAPTKPEAGEDKEAVKASSCSSCSSKPSAVGGCVSSAPLCNCGSKPGGNPGCGSNNTKPGCGPNVMPGCGPNVMPGCGPNVMPGYGPNMMPGMGPGTGNRPMQPEPCCKWKDKCTDTSPGPLENHCQIAMAYVPWQQWQKLYSMEEGFCKGTIFPDLYLPFQPRGCRV